MAGLASLRRISSKRGKSSGRPSWPSELDHRDPVGRRRRADRAPGRPRPRSPRNPPSRAASRIRTDARIWLRGWPRAGPSGGPNGAGTRASFRPSQPLRPSRSGAGPSAPSPGAAASSRAQAAKSPSEPSEARARAVRSSRTSRTIGSPLQIGRAQPCDDRVAILPQLPLDRPPEQERDVRVAHGPRRDGPAAPGSAARRRRPTAGSSRRAGCGPSRRAPSRPAMRARVRGRVHPMVVAEQADGPAPDAGDRMVEQARAPSRRRGRR